MNKKYWAYFLLSLLVISCSKTDEAKPAPIITTEAKEVSLYKSFIGIWDSGCIIYGGTATKQIITVVNDGNIEIHTVYYAHPSACLSVRFEHKIKGQVEINKTIENLDSTFSFDFSVVTSIVFGPNFASMNASSICGKTDWTQGSIFDVLVESGSCNSVMPVGAKRYDIIKLVKSSYQAFYLGDTSVDGKDKKSPEKRPIVVSYDVEYIKQ